MKKIILSFVLLAGAAVAAYAADCCGLGLACCKPGAHCCAAAKK
jgi:hypothetical protein